MGTRGLSVSGSYSLILVAEGWLITPLTLQPLVPPLESFAIVLSS